MRTARGPLLALVACLATGAAAPRTLRVCADPNNMPFSDARGRGFENRLAALVARDLGARLEFTWWAQRRGFVRQTLGAARCDLIPGVPADLEAVATTAPYYRSAYVFVTRAEAPPLSSLGDPRLRELRIGVHAVGDDYASVPPAVALARLGIVDNVRGYLLQGDYREPDPPARLVEAVVRGEVDVAIAWGPLAGYAAKRQPHGLRVTPVPEEEATAGVPLSFAIAMGVRKDDAALRRDVDRVLARRRAEIREVLESYGVPLLPMPERPHAAR
ncbi:MAG TPA: substrate-binding domain-containing protein [Gemmatimonadales bacterium]|nr:substrate-binding domain-containing protein [Gemmatimonadales bacterium]